VRIGIETAGDHTVVENNHICGTNAGICIGASWLPEIIRNNSVLGALYPIVYEGYSHVANIYGNDTSRRRTARPASLPRGRRPTGSYATPAPRQRQPDADSTVDG